MAVRTGGLTLRTPALVRQLQCPGMAFDRSRTLRGALAGAVAAGVWSAQQPLDQRVFGVGHDDAVLLGRLVTSGPAAMGLGTALHVGNGALFGALYANLAPSLPGPAAARGPLAGLAEHLATWPATCLLGRLDRLRDLPALWGSGRAFAQSTWRHLLFGAVLGELERRLNGDAAARGPLDDIAVSSNGHGAVEHLVTTEP
jgi:hypothetical protein